MKFIMFKKFSLSLVLVFLIGQSFTFAQDNSKNSAVNPEAPVFIENSSRVIDFIDNNDGTLVLNDMIYRLKLNAKVYDQSKKITNRYALKKGQRVDVKVSYSGSERYIDTIFIVGK